MTKKSFALIIPDFSVIVDGVLARLIESGEITCSEVIIHEALIAYIESQARIGTALGNVGVDEIAKISEMSNSGKISLRITGRRLQKYDNEDLMLVDASLRDLARETGAVFITSKHLQAKIAKAQGIQVHVIEKTHAEKRIGIEEFFDETTMSIHLREKVCPVRKCGRPGNWNFATARETPLSAEEVKNFSREIIEATSASDDGFIEIERPGSTIIQLGNYRIVITRPPFSDGWEITAVRPVKKLSLEEYKLSEKLKTRIAKHADGILIAGSPGQGKTTFTQALAEFYSAQGKIVKTVEAPRDMVLPENITQLAISHGSSEEVHDVLLLSRPDYTIFDEIRNTKDFELFADLRLSGVGMVGVLHATKAVDAIQRFLGRVELGVIPQVVDTVLFIKDGEVKNVLSIQMSVKVPSGMIEDDLARPVVEVLDFETGKLIAEIYSYGEETVVVPVSEKNPAENRGIRRLAAKQVERVLQRFADDVKVEVVSDNKVVVKVPEKDIGGVIGKEGKNIKQLEEDLGVSIDVQPLEYSEGKKGELLSFEVRHSKKFFDLAVGERYSGAQVSIYVKDDLIATVAVSKKGVISMTKDNKVGKYLLNAINNNEEVSLYMA